MGPHKRETKLDMEGHKGFLEKEMFQRKNIPDREKSLANTKEKHGFQSTRELRAVQRRLLRGHTQREGDKSV